METEIVPLKILIKKKLRKHSPVSKENQVLYLIDTVHVFKFLLPGLLKCMWVCVGVCYQENLVLKQSLFFYIASLLVGGLFCPTEIFLSMNNSDSYYILITIF